MSSDDAYKASAERAFGAAVVAVSVYPGVPHARVDLADGTRALIDVDGNEVGRRRAAPQLPASDVAAAPIVDEDRAPAPARLSVFCGSLGWVARADFAGRKAWSYANTLDEVRAAAESALAKVGADLDPDEPIVLEAPAMFLKLWPQIREQESYVGQLRQELLDGKQRVDELRKKSLRSLLRANVPIEDALRILTEGPVMLPGAKVTPPE